MGDGRSDEPDGTTRAERNRELRRHLAIAAGLSSSALLVPAVLSALNDDARIAMERTLPPVVAEDERSPLTAPLVDTPNGVLVPEVAVVSGVAVAPTAARTPPPTGRTNGRADGGSERAAPLVLSRPVPLDQDAPTGAGEAEEPLDGDLDGEVAAPPTGENDGGDAGDAGDGDAGTTGGEDPDDVSLGTAGEIDPVDVGTTTTTTPLPTTTTTTPEPTTTTTTPDPTTTAPDPTTTTTTPDPTTTTSPAQPVTGTSTPTTAPAGTGTDGPTLTTPPTFDPDPGSAEDPTTSPATTTTTTTAPTALADDEAALLAEALLAPASSTTSVTVDVTDADIAELLADALAPSP